MRLCAKARSEIGGSNDEEGEPGGRGREDRYNGE